MPVFLWMILLPILAAPLIYLSGHLGRASRAGQLPFALACASLGLSWWPFILAARQLKATGPSQYILGDIPLALDGVGLLLAAVALLLGGLVALYSGAYLQREPGQEKYYALLSAVTGVMIGLACSADLFNLWLWFEAMAISSYFLVTFYRRQPNSLEAGFKYLLQSAAGSVLVLLGIALVLAHSGSLTLAEIRAQGTPQPLLLAAGALFLIGFGVKTALVPLHTWLPDAHSQAPSGISALLSGVVIEAGLIALLRALSALGFISWGGLLLLFGTLNIAAGNLLALRQTQVKRLLAYSSLAHIGYMLLGLGVALSTGQVAGAQGGFFHLFNHGLMKGLAFLAAGALLYSLHLANGRHDPLTVADLAGASQRYPLLALSLSLAVLALGGLPPLAGFSSKWQIFAAGFTSQDAWLQVLVVFAGLNSVLSLAYYAPLVNALYRLQPSPAVLAGQATPRRLLLPLIVLTLFIIVLGVWPGLLDWLTLPAGQALLAAFG
ncbi:MAG: hypothetical protein JW862_14910 [Anaerolineales bacterium]|nr:hypothetical protein [Anaerolineales bacterium]